MKTTNTNRLALAISILVALVGLNATASTIPDNLTVNGSVTCTSLTSTGATAWSQVNAAGGSANPLDYTGTLGIMNGSDNFTLFDINITNANHTGASNFVYAIDIATMTQDAQATETAILIGAGWDNAIDVDGNVIVLGADGGVTLDETADDVLALTMGAGAGTASVLVGNFLVGNGTPSDAQNGEDCYIEGLFEVDGAARFDGTVTGNSSLTISGATALNGGLTMDTNKFTVADTSGNTLIAGTLTVSSATTINNDLSLSGADVDVTLATDVNGGNATNRNEFVGLVRTTFVGLGAGTNGAAAGKTLALMDDTPSGEWTAHDADTTASDNGTYYKAGTKSLGIAFSTAADAGDGAHDGVAYDFTDDESVGIFCYCDQTWSAGDLVFDMTDDGGAQVVNLPAYATINQWQWMELDISGIANGSKDVISDLSIELSAAGAVVVATRATNCFFDRAYKWDATEEEALGKAILADGINAVLSIPTAFGTNNTLAPLVEDTDYIPHYESGNDFLLIITDQSANTNVAFVSY